MVPSRGMVSMPLKGERSKNETERFSSRSVFRFAVNLPDRLMCLFGCVRINELLPVNPLCELMIHWTDHSDISIDSERPDAVDEDGTSRSRRLGVRRVVKSDHFLESAFRSLLSEIEDFLSFERNTGEREIDAALVTGDVLKRGSWSSGNSKELSMDRGLLIVGFEGRVDQEHIRKLRSVLRDEGESILNRHENHIVQESGPASCRESLTLTPPRYAPRVLVGCWRGSGCTSPVALSILKSDLSPSLTRTIKDSSFP